MQLLGPLVEYTWLNLNTVTSFHSHKRTFPHQDSTAHVRWREAVPPADHFSPLWSPASDRIKCLKSVVLQSSSGTTMPGLAQESDTSGPHKATCFASIHWPRRISKQLIAHNTQHRNANVSALDNLTVDSMGHSIGLAMSTIPGFGCRLDSTLFIACEDPSLLCSCKMKQNRAVLFSFALFESMKCSNWQCPQNETWQLTVKRYTSLSFHWVQFVLCRCSVG